MIYGGLPWAVLQLYGVSPLSNDVEAVVPYALAAPLIGFFVFFAFIRTITPELLNTWGLGVAPVWQWSKPAIRKGWLALAGGLFALACWAKCLQWAATAFHLSLPVMDFPSTLLSPLVISVLAVGSPLMEEILFRGALQSNVANTLRTNPNIARLSPAIAIAVSASVFTLLHGGYWAEPIALVNTLVLGLGLGWLRYWHGSVWPGVGLHVINNSVVVYGLLLS